MVKPRCRSRRAAAVAIATAGLLGAAPVAHAQAGTEGEPEAGASGSGEHARPRIEEIVVTARRREETLQDVPVSANAFTGTQLKALTFDDTVDLADFSPGLLANESGDAGTGRGNASFQIRGLTGGGAASQDLLGVGVYLDGVFITTGLGVDLMDIERVEVLKGPQGTLFGRNTTGGAIQIVTHKPTGEWGGYLDAKLGNYYRHDLEGALSVPFSEELAARFAFQVNRRDGYGESRFSGKEFEDDHGERYRAIFEWQPIDKLSVELIGDFARENEKGTLHDTIQVVPGDPTAGTFPFPFNCFLGEGGGLADCLYGGVLSAEAARKDERRNSADVPTYRKMDQYGATGTVSLELEDLSLRSITGWRSYDSKDAYDFDGSPAPVVQEALGENGRDYEMFSQELQAYGSAFGSNLDWITGLYYSKLESEDGISSESLVPFAGPGPLTNKSRIESTSSAAYAHGEYHLPFLPAVSIGAGVRYTKDATDMRWESYNLNAIAPTGNGAPFCALFDPISGQTRLTDPCAVKRNEDWSEWTYGFNVNWHPNDDLLLYVTTRKGYRAGGFNALADEGLTYQPFNPEINRDIEVGIKSDFTLWDVPLRVDLAAFHMVYEDIQRGIIIINQVNNVPTLVTRNAAEATIHGGEFEMIVLPHPDLYLHLGFAFVDGKYDDYFADLDGDGVPEDNSHLPFDVGPTYTFNIISRYTAPSEVQVGGVELGMGFAQVAYSWKDDDVLSESSGLTQGNHGLLDYRVGFEGFLPGVLGDRVDVSFYMRNALDRVVRVGTFGIASLGYGIVNYRAPRTFGVQFTYHWGSR